MTRAELLSLTRNMLRQQNLAPFSDLDVLGALGVAEDDLATRVQYAQPYDRRGSVKGKREYVIPLDIVATLQCFYMDAAGSLIAAAMTAASPADGEDLAVLTDTADFPTSGMLQIEEEYLLYDSKTASSFVSVTRGANGSVAADHATPNGVIEAGKSFVPLKPVQTLTLSEQNAQWMSATPGVPESYYMRPGVLGFNRPNPKTGFLNILLCDAIRPPTSPSLTDPPEFLLEPYHYILATHAAHQLAVRLAQDEASQAQAARWLQDYLAAADRLEDTYHQFAWPHTFQMLPQTGRR